MNECPTPQKIAAFLLDELDSSENQAIAIHVDACTQCEQVMDSLVENVALGEMDPESEAGPEPSPDHAPESEPKAAQLEPTLQSVHSTLGQSLLFGLLALHNSFVSRTQLVAATSEWLEDKTRKLPDIFVEQNAIDSDDRKLIELLVKRHLASNGNDVEKSLAGLGSSDILKAELAQLNDPDVEASLSLMPTLESEWDTSNVAAPVKRRYPERERFKQVRSHAKGGLGEVFVAVDQQLDRNVALKRIRPRMADNQHARLRFELEAEVTGKLEHPGIVPVYALGANEAGQPFYVMRFIKGQTLKEEIAAFHQEHGSATWRTGAARIQLHQLISQLVDVCNTVEYAHHRGVLHRDLKPDNVMLGKFGETIVVDWGLAKKAGSASHQVFAPMDLDESVIQPEEGSDATPTTFGTVVGTIGYMSPEQASGTNEGLGPTSDVYGLGAILYRMLTNQTSQDVGDGKAEVLRKIEAGEFKSPRERNPNVPAALESICLKAMATKVEDRYQSARLMAEELELWLAEESVTAHRESFIEKAFRLMRRHRGLFLIGLATLSAVVATLIAAYAFREASIARAAQTKAVSDIGVVRDLAKSTVDGWLSGPADDLRDVPGMNNFRKHLLESAAGAFDKLANQETDDPQLELDRARTRMKLGEGQMDLGDVEEAEQSFLEAKRILQSKVFAETPLRIDAKFEATNCDAFLSQLRNVRGDTSADALDAAIVSYQDLIASQPSNAHFAQGYGAALTQRAQLRIDEQRFEDAEADARSAIEQFETLVARSGGNDKAANLASASSDLSEARSLLGECFLRQGKLEDAETYFTNAISEVVIDTSNPQRDLIESRADARSYLAQVHRAKGRLARELAETRDRIADYDLLSRQFADVVRYQESLARSKMDEGLVLLLLGKAQLANQSLTESSLTFAELQATHPFRRKLVNALAASLDGLAVSQTLLGQYEQASASVERALGVFSRNQDLDRLATSLGHYAEILEQQERFNEAKAAYAQATTVLVQRVATADGSQKQAIDDKTRLAFIFTSFGSMLFELGDEDADAMLTTAKSYWSDVASASPANQNEYARFLVTCVDKDQRDQALATTVAEIATQASPGNADFLATLAAAHFHSADVERAIELLDEAKGVRNGERGFDMFVRAMSLAKQDRVAEARKVRQSASEWLAKEMPGSATLRRLEAEAKEILEAKATDG